MIPPRLRREMVRMFLFTHEATRGPNMGRRKVHMGDNITTNAGHIRPMDLRALERKGLVTYEIAEHMTSTFGVLCWHVKITDAGKEEIADDFAEKCAEADAHNAKLEEDAHAVAEIEGDRLDGSKASR